MSQVKEIYYLYVCKVDGVVRYIGMGKKDRYKHCTSGKSSCVELNRDFLLGKDVKTEFVKKNLTEAQARALEEEMILANKEELYNKVVKARPSKIPGVARMKNSTVLASNWSYEEKQVKIYEDKARSIFPDQETEQRVLDALIQNGLALYVVQTESGTKMLVVDKCNEYEMDRWWENNFAHLAHPDGLYSAKYGVELEYARY